eukprot:CAMPEP_0179311870 /NCGR_PEP_ID=MMETSP0797-20121207/52928_1 /TAXON_ID=47934 /ORGANISM="Dinophysis acuminata, Strain DAEP01" /LENGTH=80 /DNA_ID=CAMNT_0021021695 /DNA_START=14 /DNA_END=253 /DNA_ORIENTATION=-
MAITSTVDSILVLAMSLQSPFLLPSFFGAQASSAPEHPRVLNAGCAGSARSPVSAERPNAPQRQKAHLSGGIREPAAGRD